MNRLVPDVLSVSRMAGAAALLFTGGLNWWFLAVFTFCSVTDVLDGYLARKHGICSGRGEVLDSVADFAVVLAMLAVLIPTVPWDPWMIQMIVLIASIRGVSLCIGTLRHGEVALLHTSLNKLAGLLLRLAPYAMLSLDLSVVVAAVCSVSLAGAVEDLAINVRSKSLDRNIRSYLDLRIPNSMKYGSMDERS